MENAEVGVDHDGYALSHSPISVLALLGFIG
jgi:hypothetical protein